LPYAFRHRKPMQLRSTGQIIKQWCH
jgi:hypothetical protein